MLQQIDLYPSIVMQEHMQPIIKSDAQDSHGQGHQAASREVCDSRPNVSPDLVFHAITSLSTILEDLERDTTCVICLDPMVDACQMSCGHYFCGTCVERILRQPNTDKQKMRCALCKHPTTKRSIRSAPIPIAGIIASSQKLKALVEYAQSRSTSDDPAGNNAPKQNKMINDGFPMSLRASTSSRDMVQLQNLSTSSNSSCIFNENDRGHSEVCALCPSNFDTLCKDTHDTEFGYICTVTVSSRTKQCFRVHEECALYSEDVYHRNGKLVNADKAIKTSRNVCCSRQVCKETGASVRCAAGNCSKVFHYVCAVVCKCAVVNDGSYKIFCPAHKRRAPVIENDVFEELKVAADSSQARQSPDVCFECGAGGRLLLCDGCDNSCHVGCSRLRSIPLGEWLCRVCKESSLAKVLAKADDKENNLPTAYMSSSKRSRKRPSEKRIDGHPLEEKRTRIIANDGNRSPRQALVKKANLQVSAEMTRPTTGLSEYGSMKSDRKNCDLESNLISTLMGDNQCFESTQKNTDYGEIRNDVSRSSYKRSGKADHCYVLLPTGLNVEDKRIIRAAQKRHRNTISIASEYSRRVTHIIVNARSPDEFPVRTVKLCKGVVSNLPVVCFSWILKASKVRSLPDVQLYLHNCSHASKQYPFAGLRFYFGVMRDQAVRKEDLMHIIQLGKGSIMLNEPTVNTSASQGKIYYVREAVDGNESTYLSRRRCSAADLQRHLPSGCEVISPGWILDNCFCPSQD